MRPKGALDLQPIDNLGPRPSLGRAQYNRRPSRPRAHPIQTRVILRAANDSVASLERLGKFTMHPCWIIAFHKMHVVAVTGEQFADVVVGIAAKHRRAGNLVTVKMKDR